MAIPLACLFDLDGLLLDTEPLQERAWREAAARFGIRLEAAHLAQLRGRRREDCADLVVEWIRADGLRCDGRQALLAVRQPIAEGLLPMAPPIEGAEALVRRCHGLGVPMALATSSSREAVALKEAPHPWLGLIRTRVHGDDPALGAGKPAPDVFLLAAERLGVDPTGCWAFEDSAAGAWSASRAGCQVHVLAADKLTAEAYPGNVQWLNSLNDVRF